MQSRDEPPHISGGLEAALNAPPSGRELLESVRRTHHTLSLALDRAVGGLGLSHAQVEVMTLLETHPTIHAGEIGRRLGTTRQAAHRLLRQLELAACAEQLPHDGFARGARLTSLGRARLRQARGAQADVLAALDRQSPEARRATVEALRDLETALRPRAERWW
jgi:DNA-binding MarR family transcriptional regulator